MPPFVDTNLPEFDNPPVVEVASSIQFKAIEGLDTTRLARLWAVYRERYPRTEQQPPISHEIETFDLPTPPRMTFKIQPALARLRWWFMNDEGTRLLQIQHDRFALNWRKLEREEEKYPHYKQLRGQLLEEFGHFDEFLRGEGLSSPVPDQVELTYVNHIPAGQPGGPREPAARFTTLWGGEPVKSLLPAAEELNFATRYVMYDDAGKPLGRLHIQLESSYKVADNSPVFGLQLMGRGAPEGDGLAGAFKFLDRAHRWIVQSFADITTPEMHKLWKRKP